MADINTDLLRGCRVLLLEDDYFLADDLRQAFSGHGAEVLGPIADIKEALDAVMRDGFDVAVMNVTLREAKAFFLADELTKQKVPFIFVTGFSATALPERFRQVKVVEKPFLASEIANDVARLWRPSSLPK